MAEDDLRGRRVAVLGIGIEGLDLARFIWKQGAEVTAFDTRTSAATAQNVDTLAAMGVQVRNGPWSPESFDGFDALYVSQSILLSREPAVQRALRRGCTVGSMLSEFYRRWSGPIAGITGSSGKTTTTALVASAFAAHGVPHVVGGNIGVGLLAALDHGDRGTWAVIEVSHTQLQLADRSPAIAAVTNVTPNHLDQFSWDEYVALKRNHVRHQSRDDVAVLNATDPIGAAFNRETAARIIWFNDRVVGCDCVFSDANRLVARAGGVETAFLARAEIPLRGEHNVENVLAAAAVAVAAGIPLETFAGAVRTFRPVAHRLEIVGTVAGVTYVNDSIATTPERTLAGIRSFDEPLVLLLGGREKHLPLEELARAAHARARIAICFGEAGPALESALRAAQPTTGPHATVRRVQTLDQATAAAHEQAQRGDVVLLSPACTSFDAYPNFERRGEAFRSLVCDLAAVHGEAGCQP